MDVNKLEKLSNINLHLRLIKVKEKNCYRSFSVLQMYKMYHTD